MYRNEAHHSRTKVLRDRFPVVRRLVGTTFFVAAAHEFVRVSSPTFPILAKYGVTCPEHIAGFASASGLPYLAGAAWLLWMRGCAYHAADAEALTPGQNCQRHIQHGA